MYKYKHRYRKKMDKTTGCNFMNKNVLLSIHSIHVKKSKLLQILSSDQSTYSYVFIRKNFSYIKTSSRFME